MKRYITSAVVSLIALACVIGCKCAVGEMAITPARFTNSDGTLATSTVFAVATSPEGRSLWLGAGHSARGATSVSVAYAGEWRPAFVRKWARNAAADFAVIEGRFSVADADLVPVVNYTPQRGEQLRAVGFSSGQRQDRTGTYRGDVREWLSTSIPFDEGMSGGPLMVRHGDSWAAVGTISTRDARTGGNGWASRPGDIVAALDAISPRIVRQDVQQCYGNVCPPTQTVPINPPRYIPPRVNVRPPVYVPPSVTVPTVSDERLTRLIEDVIAQNPNRFRGDRGLPGLQGPPGLDGKDGERGPAGQGMDPGQVQVIISELERLRDDLENAQVTVELSDGTEPAKLSAPLGEAIVLPPVRMTITDRGETYAQQKPLGNPIRMEVTGMLEAK